MTQTTPARPLPASLRALAIDPDHGGQRAAGVRVLPWEEDPESPFERWTTYAHREGHAVTALTVTGLAPGCWVALVRADRGTVGHPAYHPTRDAAASAAETAAVAHALRRRTRPAASA